MTKDIQKLDWLIESGLKKASFWETLVDQKVRCSLCPRQCVIGKSRFGFCKSRYNKNGVLNTAIWGKLLVPSIEPIETEAVFHYRPGAKILSIGNLGCNLECDFCQNWESANLINLSPEFVRHYTPKEIIDLTISLGIDIISFTYNDPAIWFEFVYETATLARENGLQTLFKSAGFISTEVAKYLTKVIDIFSISLKSSNPETFRRMSKGILSSVLDSIKIFHKSKSHLELSNLVVTGMTDIEGDIRKLVSWIKQELSDDVPLHFVRFHPAYKYIDVERTPINFLEKARDIALEEGLKYVYIGNTYNENHADVYCRSCGNVMIKRFGLYTTLEGVSKNGNCIACGKNHNIIFEPEKNIPETSRTFINGKSKTWTWGLGARNLHVEINNSSKSATMLVCKHFGKNGDVIASEEVIIPEKQEFRVAFGQCVENEEKVRIDFPENVDCRVVELLDRAHFPLADCRQDNINYN